MDTIIPSLGRGRVGGFNHNFIYSPVVYQRWTLGALRGQYLFLFPVGYDSEGGLILYLFIYLLYLLPPPPLLLLLLHHLLLLLLLLPPDAVGGGRGQYREFILLK
jgi:hypothetical protein